MKNNDQKGSKLVEQAEQTETPKGKLKLTGKCWS